MDQEVFYKDQYDKSLAERAEINNSLSMPIGIITAILAGLYFCTTTFDYNDGWWLSFFFIALSVLTTGFLLASIIFLILAFADFVTRRTYMNLNDAEVLNQYYESLLAFYTNSPLPGQATPESMAKAEFDKYLLAELIRNATINQRTNRIKTAFLFQSHRFMIYAIISISLLIIPFGIDFGHNRGKDKVQKVEIIKYQKDTTERLNIKLKHYGNQTPKRTKTGSATVTHHP